MLVLIGNMDGKNRLYLHDVYQIEKPQQNILTKHVLDSLEQATSRHSAEGGAKVQQNIETTKDILHQYIFFSSAWYL